MANSTSLNSAQYWQDESDSHNMSLQGWISAGAVGLSAGTMGADIGYRWPDKSPFSWQITLAVSMLWMAFSVGMAARDWVYSQRAASKSHLSRV
jgi:hypothetical protein